MNYLGAEIRYCYTSVDKKRSMTLITQDGAPLELEIRDEQGEVLIQGVDVEKTLSDAGFALVRREELLDRLIQVAVSMMQARSQETTAFQQLWAVLRMTAGLSEEVLSERLFAAQESRGQAKK